MGIRGPLPKDSALRQRRNAVPANTTLSADSGKQRRVPPLPRLETGQNEDGTPKFREWHPLTRQWWRDSWQSPMAAEYLKVDIHGLYRLAILIDEFWRDPTEKRAAEIRQQLQPFGQTPLDRSRLRWEIERTEAATEKKRPAASQPDTEPIEDPRSVLKIVGGKA